MNKDDLKILQSDYDKTRVSRLSDRPNVGRAMGGQGLSAQELKARLDASSALIVERFNALIEALAGVDEDGERCEGVADLIMTGLGDGYSLADLFADLASGEATQRIKAGIGEYTLKGYLQYIKHIIDALEEEQDVLKDTVSTTIEKAIEEAEKAAENAIIDELGDAQNAATIAQKAAMTANAAATRAEDVLEEVVGQAKNDKALYANALKGTATGEAVKMDDVSPLPHEMAVKVRGVNILPYPYSESSVTRDGITFTDNRDGTITANGTATKRAQFLIIPSSANFTLRKGTYTVSGCPKGGGGDTYGIWTSGGQEYGEGKTFDYNGGVFFFNITIVAGATVENLVFKPMLEYGATATSYAPYIEDISAVKVLAQGKNLANIYGFSAETLKGQDSARILSNSYGTTISTTEPSNTVEITQTATGNASSTSSYVNGYFYIGLPRKPLEGEQVTASFDVNITSNPLNVNALTMFVNDINVGAANIANGRCRKSFTYSAGTTGEQSIEVRVCGCSMVVSNIQLELGGVATDREPAIAPTEHAVNADGTVDGVAAIHPTTTLMTDTVGAVLDVGYNRDINKAFEQLVNAIISQGGNV